MCRRFLPTALDQKVVARATLRADSFARWTNLDNFEDAALDALAADDLNPERRRNLLQRLRRPDVPNLVKLIIDDLKAFLGRDFPSSNNRKIPRCQCVIDGEP